LIGIFGSVLALQERWIVERDIAKVFINGRSQAVRIPKQYRFASDEVYIEKVGEEVILRPKPKSWDQFFAAPKCFTEDFPEDINDIPPEERKSFE
jgi:antitoxin VapB